MKHARLIVLAALLAAACAAQQMQAQQRGDLGDIQTKLYAEFTLTQATADFSDLVTPGSVLLLHKSGLPLIGTNAPNQPTYVYKDGRFLITAGSAFQMNSNGRDGTPGNLIPKRTFVAGEKFWITEIKVQPDSVVLGVYSDAYNGIRYYGKIKIVYPEKKVIPPTANLLQMVHEVVTVAPVDNSSAPAPADQQFTAPAAPAQAAQIAPIPPPPPPSDQPPAAPKTIELGQSRDVVVATLGQPSKDIKLGAKEILVYSDMKVTLIGGQVSDVQ